MGFLTAGKLLNHVVNRSRCKPAASEVLLLAEGDAVVPAAPEVLPVEGDAVPAGDTNVPAAGVIAKAPAAELDHLADMIRGLASVPDGRGDSGSQEMDLSSGDLVINTFDNVEDLLRPDVPLTFLVGPAGADGTVSLEPML
jgi:hypothetical protein